MDDEPQKAKPKLDLVIILGIGVIMLCCDFVELIPLAGDLLDLAVGMPLNFFLWIKGLNGTSRAVEWACDLAEAIPFVQELPLWTLSWVAVCLIDRNQKLEQLTEIVGGFAGGEASVGTGALSEAGQAAATAEKTAEEAARATSQAAQTAAKEGEVVAEVGAASAEGGVSAASRGAEGVEGAEKEGLGNRLKEEVQGRIQEGLEGATGEGEEESPEQEEKEEDLNRQLGEPEPVMESLENQYLGDEPLTASTEAAEEEEVAPVSKAVPHNAGVKSVSGGGISAEPEREAPAGISVPAAPESVSPKIEPTAPAPQVSGGTVSEIPAHQRTEAVESPGRQRTPAELPRREITGSKAVPSANIPPAGEISEQTPAVEPSSNVVPINRRSIAPQRPSIIEDASAQPSGQNPADIFGAEVSPMESLGREMAEPEMIRPAMPEAEESAEEAPVSEPGPKVIPIGKRTVASREEEMPQQPQPAEKVPEPPKSITPEERARREAEAVRVREAVEQKLGEVTGPVARHEFSPEERAKIEEINMKVSLGEPLTPTEADLMDLFKKVVLFPAKQEDEDVSASPKSKKNNLAQMPSHELTEVEKQRIERTRRMQEYWQRERGEGASPEIDASSSGESGVGKDDSHTDLPKAA